MAPEMEFGDRVDGRADLYALGCVAYYLLTGAQVFEGATAMQIMSKHLQAAPAPPSARGTFTIPGELDAVVLSCLAKAPEERPRSAAELARRLSAIDVEPWRTSRRRTGGWRHGRRRNPQTTRRSRVSSLLLQARRKRRPDSARATHAAFNVDLPSRRVRSGDRSPGWTHRHACLNPTTRSRAGIHEKPRRRECNLPYSCRLFTAGC